MVGLVTSVASKVLGRFDLSDLSVMSRWARDWAPFILGLVLLGVVIVWAGWAYRQPAAGIGDTLARPGFVVALAGVVVGVIPLLVSLGRRSARGVDILAALLAEAVDGQWRQVALERRLRPEPIPLRWSLSDLAVTGPVNSALGAPEGPPAFPPLSEMARITEADLQAGGGRAELHSVYAGLASGRIVVVGAPGAGKSGTAILLVLDALTHYYSVDDAQRARVPVPVLLTAHGWDPNACSVRDWLCDQLTAIYPMFARRGGRAEAADLVAARDKIALVLDGFDEMDPALRPAALQALSDAPFRVVVLTRDPELVEAASSRWLTGALVVRLRSVTALAAIDYLQRARTGPAPQGWADLLTHLGEQVDGVLAGALSTPLSLTLLRDTYQAGDDVGELLDSTRFGTIDAVEQHLIARLLPAAYTPVPGRPPPRYSEQQARQTLSFIAQRMGSQRDLAWWQIPRWAPAVPRVLTTVFVFVLGGGGGFAAVVGAGFPGGWLMVALWCLFGFRYGRQFGTGGGEPRRVRIPHWRAALSRQSFRRTLLSGLPLGFGVGIGLVSSGRAETWVGIGIGIAFGIASVLTDLAIGSGAGTGLPMGPRQVWRNDRLSGLALGLAVVLMIPLAGGHWLTDRFGLTLGLAYGLPYGLIGSQTWPTTLAWLQLQLSHRVPAIRLIPFLDDARERGILRTVGAVYQFRHARLQDHLNDATATVSRSS